MSFMCCPKKKKGVLIYAHDIIESDQGLTENSFRVMLNTNEDGSLSFEDLSEINNSEYRKTNFGESKTQIFSRLLMVSSKDPSSA